MSEHTPGPWKLDGYSGSILDEKGLIWIADCSGNNETLITSAPDMYNLLKEISKCYSWEDMDFEAIHKLLNKIDQP